jgi:signal transduction histidine kinase
MDFFGMTKEELRNKVFSISIESYASLEDVNDSKNNERYVQIKRQKFKSDTKDYDMLKIVDVSMDVLYERSQGEKKLLTVINATVSHEMRNPINSINTLNIKQQEINDKLSLLIEKLDKDVTPL